MFSAPKFSPSFWAPNVPSASPLATQSSPSVATQPPVIFNPEVHGTNFADFQATDQFKRCQSEYLALVDNIIQFAHHHASALSPPLSDAALHTIKLHFGDLKDHLTNDQVDYFASQKPVVYGAGKHMLVEFERLLQNRDLPLQQRIDAIKAMAEGISTCSGGLLTAITEGVGALKMSASGLRNMTLQKKIQVIEAAILDHVMKTHTHTRGDEVHYVNAYFNYLAETFGLVKRLDPYAENLIANPDNDILGNLDACKQSVGSALTPGQLARMMADDYLSRMRDAAAAKGLNIHAPFNVEQTKRAFDVTSQLQQDCLNREFGEVSSNNYLIGLTSKETGVFSFQLPSDSTRLTLHFMGEMRKNQFVDYQNSRTLTEPTEVQGSIMQLGDLFWVDNGGECDPLTGKHLLNVSLAAIFQNLQKLGVDPAEIHEILYSFMVQINNSASLEEQMPPREFNEKRLRLLGECFSLLPDLLTQLEPGIVNVIMFAAAETDHLVLLRLLVDNGADLEAENEYGTTALMVAAQHGRVEVASLLIERGADMDASDVDGFTAMMFATMQDQVEVVHLLIEKSADLDASNDEGWTAAMFAASTGKVGALKSLIEAGADIHATNADGQTAVILAAKSESADGLRLLIEKGANPNAVDDAGNTALMGAVQGDNLAAMHILLHAGADIGIKNQHGDTAEMIAKINDHSEAHAMLNAWANLS